ncbi:MAG: CDGSH iron-sulfur domain-containing protein [Bdellovibrionales bacterium]|nr:CDGSH iron-sulfur domain-containing protein [Bdellovibrionales bacterium]
MPDPKIASKQGAVVQVEAGKTYMWCACGNSTNQPFCDGKHSGTGFSPVVFTAEKDGAMVLCQCKHSKNAPRCDGSHSKLN